MSEENINEMTNEEPVEGTEEVGKTHHDSCHDSTHTEKAQGDEGEEVQEEAKLTVEEQLTLAQQRVQELETELLYKRAEFDNYRKNVMKEKTDLILNGGRKVLESVLPVVDDMERAMTQMDETEDTQALKEGVELIHRKLLQTLKAHGVEPMDTKDKDFDTDHHEAIAQMPAPNDGLKGKVLDCTKKGYTINNKVLRFAQVVVGV